MTIPTRTQTPELRHARSVLAGLADALPGLAAIPAIEALAAIDMVAPPYPPVQRPAPDVEVTHALAIAALCDAARVAVDPAEAARIAHAGYSLNDPVPL